MKIPSREEVERIYAERKARAEARKQAYKREAVLYLFIFLLILGAAIWLVQRQG